MTGPNKMRKVITRIADWILVHTRIIMPVILIVCVLVTVVVALNANERTQLEEEAETVAAAQIGAEPEGSAEMTGLTVPDIPLEKNQYPEVNELINRYYQMFTDGDIDSIEGIYVGLNEIATIRIQEIAKYIDHYDTIDVYTKPGLTEDSFVAYVYSEVRFKDVETLIPGMQALYLMRNEAGDMIIMRNDLDDNIFDYIAKLSLQDDVVDLYNKINVAYNDLIAADKEVEEYVAYMTDKLDEDVGEVLAKSEQPDITADTVKEEIQPETTPTPEGESEAVAPVTTGSYQAKAIEVVNIRSSDSETADRLDRAMTGQEFTVLEARGNGWSRIQYNDGEAYIKSEFLEKIDTPETPTDTPEDPTESASQAVTAGTVKAKESVKVRSTAGTDGESLGTVYSGEELDFVEQMSNGWTKVKYQGQIGYVKSEYVE